MTPAAPNPPPIRLVIFDCDGVLIDSEGPSNRVVAEEISKLGWPMTTAESTALFVGYQLGDIPRVVEAHTGRPVPEGWVETLRTAIIAAFDTIETVPGARPVLEGVASLGLPFRVASNSSHAEMRVKFGNTGLHELVGDRQHSAYDVRAGKPAPDVFLAAAAAEGVPPAQCLVVEDSIPGIHAALAAGMRVVALDVTGTGEAQRKAGATTIASLEDLLPLLRNQAA